MEKQIQSKEMVKLYFWTLSYFKPFILLTLLYVLCGGIMIWGELMIPLRMGYLIDNVLPLNSMEALITQILILCGIVVLILVIKWIYVNILDKILGFFVVITPSLTIQS